MNFRRGSERRTRRRPPIALMAGAVGSAALALSMTGTLSAFTAQIQNSGNSAATGVISMRETLLDAAGNPTSTTCSSGDNGTTSATCASINKYGGTGVGLVPGGAANVTRIGITNSGNVPATAFTLSPGACVAAPQPVNGGAALGTVCGKFLVTISSGGRSIWSGPASSMPASINVLSALGAVSVPPGAQVPITFSVALDPNADATFSGFTISQALTWTFTA